MQSRYVPDWLDGNLMNYSEAYATHKYEITKTDYHATVVQNRHGRVLHLTSFVLLWQSTLPGGNRG